MLARLRADPREHERILWRDPAARRADDLGACDVVACTVALAAPAAAPTPPSLGGMNGFGFGAPAMTPSALSASPAMSAPAQAPAQSGQDDLLGLF